MKKILIILILFIPIISCSKLNFFGFGEKKNKFEELKINEYLWKASNDLMKNYPNTETDLKEGNISSGWIITERNPNIRFRILIYILGYELIEENLQIFTEKEFNNKGIWQRQRTSEAFNTNLKIKIMKDAESLEKNY
mgnify:FL=1